ncbi:MAG: DUF368 domain-containing protein [Bacilli bacterium]|nr:DUF368 domain-containing protein [Bacilli bacterium]
MYQNLSLIIKGMIIGLGKIIPGVSGSLFALNLGLYEKGIDSISNFFKKPKENLIFLGTVGIGILISIIVFSKILNYMLIKYYVITMFLFIGLLLGSSEFLIKKNKPKNLKELILFIFTFLIMIIICFIKTKSEYNYTDNFLNKVFVFIIGLIDASTMIIPGISGTAVLMLMGCYNFFLSIFVNITNLNLININIIIYFSLGLFIGIILITKLMNHLLNKKKNIIYPIIIGFSLSSIVILFIETIFKIKNMYEIIFGIVLLIIGFKISKTYGIE